MGLVRRRIGCAGERLWRLEDFGDLPFSAVAQSLSRLTREGTIERLSKGVYYSARQTAFGKSLPSPTAIQELASRRKTVYPAGIAAANLLGFTTQTARRSEVSTSALSLPRKLIGNETVVHTRRPEAWARLSEVDAALLDLPGMVLDASMGVMSCLLVQCSGEFGFPEGAGQLREQGLLHWANLWHFHLVRVRVHASILHIWSEFYMFSYQFVTCHSPLRIRPSQEGRTALDGGAPGRSERTAVFCQRCRSPEPPNCHWVVPGECSVEQEVPIKSSTGVADPQEGNRYFRGFPFRMFPLRRDLIVQPSAYQPSWNDFVPCWMGHLKFYYIFLFRKCGKI
jgi:hypothetical protein